MSEYIPAGHRVLIRVKTIKETTEGGIILPQKAKERENAGASEGVVEAVGPTAYKDFTGESWVKVGDRVMYRRYEGVTIEDKDGDLLRVINDDDIYAIIKD